MLSDIKYFVTNMSERRCIIWNFYSLVHILVICILLLIPRLPLFYPAIDTHLKNAVVWSYFSSVKRRCLLLILHSSLERCCNVMVLLPTLFLIISTLINAVV